MRGTPFLGLYERRMIERMNDGIRTSTVTTRSVCLGLILMVGACAPSDTPSKDTEARPEIALIMKSLANEFFVTMADGAKAHQEAHSGQFDLILNGTKDERDYNQQVALVEQMIAKQVDAIVIAPADSKALVRACKRALDAGIVVINIDNKLDAEVMESVGIHVPFVGPDNRRGARVVGEYLAERLQNGDEVAIIEGVPTAFNAQQRSLGFEDAMEAAGMKIVSKQSGHWETDQAYTVASAMVSEYPNLKALLCGNDSMALGAVAAVKIAGKSEEIFVVGFDNISAVQEMLKDGRILSTADQHADKMAVFGIEFALQILRGETSPSDRETPVDLATAEGLP